MEHSNTWSIKIIPPGVLLLQDTNFGKNRACDTLHCTRAPQDSLSKPSRWHSPIPGPVPRHPGLPVAATAACPGAPRRAPPPLLQSWLSAIFSPPPCYFAFLAGVYNWPGQPHLLSAFSPFPSLSQPLSEGQTVRKYFCSVALYSIDCSICLGRQNVWVWHFTLNSC